MAIPEASLFAAASSSYPNIYPFWRGATLKTHMTTFYTALLGTFPQQDPGGHPLANWVAIIVASTQNLSAESPPGTVSGRVPYTEFVALQQYVYRFLLLTKALSDGILVPAQISSAQAAVVLAAYNTAFA